MSQELVPTSAGSRGSECPISIQPNTWPTSASAASQPNASRTRDEIDPAPQRSDDGAGDARGRRPDQHLARGPIRLARTADHEDVTAVRDSGDERERRSPQQVVAGLPFPNTPPAKAIPVNMNGRAKTKRIGTRLPNTNQDSAGTTITCTFTTTLAIPAPTSESTATTTQNPVRATDRRAPQPTARWSRFAHPAVLSPRQPQQRRQGQEATEENGGRGPDISQLDEERTDRDRGCASDDQQSRVDTPPRSSGGCRCLRAVTEVRVVTRQCSCR